jgi:hypothetical protein
MTGDGLRALGGLTSLNSLNLACCEHVSDAVLSVLASLRALARLNLDFCNQVSDDGLSALQASLPSLYWQRDT